MTQKNDDKSCLFQPLLFFLYSSLPFITHKHTRTHKRRADNTAVATTGITLT